MFVNVPDLLLDLQVGLLFICARFYVLRQLCELRLVDESVPTIHHLI